ncbi:MAG: cysteine dioxygenase family protein [Bacteroidetes bacterium]|nr:cysteine dioxygenase family protein [Bacteroidota bacterium]
MIDTAKLSPSLQRLLEGIENNNITDSNRLVSLMKALKLNADDFNAYTFFDHSITESYGRKKIYEGENFVIFLMSWAVGDFTAIHSHGNTDWGGVYFCDDINHRLYQVENNNIELKDSSIIPAGTIVAVNGSLVHAMGNLSNKPLKSLHIYGSNQKISNANDFSRVYELEKNQIRTTDGAAYININENKCKETEVGLYTTKDTILDYFSIILPFYKKNKLNDMADYIEAVMKNPDLYFSSNKINCLV